MQHRVNTKCLIQKVYAKYIQWLRFVIYMERMELCIAYTPPLTCFSSLLMHLYSQLSAFNEWFMAYQSSGLQ